MGNKIAGRVSRVFRSLILSLLPIGLAACTTLPVEDKTLAETGLERATVIAGADLLPMTGQGILPRQTIIVSGNRIVEIRPFADRDLAAEGRVVDARGQVLMPGLVDMHVHFAPSTGENADPAQRAAAVMLAHGVTTARSMAGSPEHIALRERLAKHQIPGPRIFIGSPAMTDRSVSTVAGVKEAVREIEAAGYDFLKSHHITDPVIWQAVADEAQAVGLATAGHVANAVGLERAISAGQQIEHLDGYIQALLPADAPERNVEFGQIPPPAILARIDRDAIAGHAVFDLAARANSYQVPTLSLFEKLLDTRTSATDLRNGSEMRYVPDAAIEQWAAQRTKLAQEFTPSHADDLVRLRREIVRQLDDHGVPLMAGSDTAQAFHVWGPALHEEIRILAEIIGTQKALRAATAVPAEYFRTLPDHGSASGAPADFGTIYEGALADLLLLPGNPVADLAALNRPVAVIADGRFFGRAALDALLDNAARAAKSSSPQASGSGGEPAIFLTRHFQAEESGQRKLTVAGREQARMLADALADRGVRAIYVTDTLRARQSAEPLADTLGITVQVYDPSRPDILLKQVVQAGVPALIVAHSNTAPQIAQMAGVPIDQAGELTNYGFVMAISSAGVETVPLGSSLAGSGSGKVCPPGFPADAQCGTVQVPENRAVEGGRLLAIQYAVLPATGKPTDDPLVVFPGGPGLGAVQSGAGIAQLFAGFREERDILLIDQRGTGNSNRLSCPSSEKHGGLLASLEPIKKSFVKDCLAALSRHADPSRYVTRQATLDVEVVRRELGYDRLDLFGMSYGTRPVLDYLALFPEHTGEVVIRAAAPVEMKLPLWAPQDAQKSFDRLVIECKAQTDCARRHPDLADDLRRMFELLANEPAAITIVHPLTGQQVSGTLDVDGLQRIMFFMLYIPEFASQLPSLMDRAISGEFSPLVQAVTPALVGLVDQVAWGLRWSVICSEDIPQINPSEIEAATARTFMGRAIIDEDIMACSHWPKATVPPDYGSDISSSHPVLVISGRFDPIAGDGWGELLVNDLNNARHISVTNASHLPALPGCTAEEVRAFLTTGDLGRINETCPENTRRLRLSIVD